MDSKSEKMIGYTDAEEAEARNLIHEGVCSSFHEALERVKKKQKGLEEWK